MTDEQIIQRIRILLGNISEEDLPTTVIEMFLSTWKYSMDVENHPERLPLAVYNTMISCVNWLIVQEVSSGNSSVTERLEKIGDETISIKGGSSWASWKDFLEWLLENPDYVDPSLNNVSGLVIVGGVRWGEYHRVKCDRDSRNGFMEQGIYPRPPLHIQTPGGRRSPFTLGERNR